MSKRLFLSSNFGKFLRTAAMSAKPVQVHHAPEEKRFIAEIDGCQEKGIIDYEIVGVKTWDLQHTLVPEAFRGQGVGRVLAKAAFDHIVKEDLKMKLSCWYLKLYAEKNPLPEYMERIVQ